MAAVEAAPALMNRLRRRTPVRPAKISSATFFPSWVKLNFLMCSQTKGLLPTISALSFRAASLVALDAYPITTLHIQT